MKIGSYIYRRINFNGTIKVDYKSNFEDARKNFNCISELRAVIKYYDTVEKENSKTINNIMSWWHYEPYVEFTYAIKNNIPKETIDHIENKLLQIIYQYTEEKPEINTIDGPGWYHTSEEEHMFELLTMVKGCDLTEKFYHYMPAIENGKGLEKQYVRKCHLLANQLGINYKLEGRYLFWRSVLCFLFYYLGHKKAVWIYTKIFRQKY